MKIQEAVAEAGGQSGKVKAYLLERPGEVFRPAALAREIGVNRSRMPTDPEWRHEVFGNNVLIGCPAAISALRKAIAKQAKGAA